MNFTELLLKTGKIYPRNCLDPWDPSRSNAPGAPVEGGNGWCHLFGRVVGSGAGACTFSLARARNPWVLAAMCATKRCPMYNICIYYDVKYNVYTIYVYVSMSSCMYMYYTIVMFRCLCTYMIIPHLKDFHPLGLCHLIHVVLQHIFQWS